MNERERAEDLVAEGVELEEKGERDTAERRYLDAIELAPEWHVPYYNLGLMAKYESRWQESLAWNQKAAERAPDNEASWWNLGIAATAVGNWGEARRAWAAVGMTVPQGEGPPDFNFGATPVRLDPNGQAEVVWAHRIDPARARVLNVPLPTSRHNYGDIVLTDGAPEGVRVVEGRRYHVFNALALLVPSPLRKYIIELASVGDNSITALEKIAEASGGGAENWGTSTNILCARCSRGVPHEHSGDGAPAHPHCGLAARDVAHAEEIIRQWLDNQPGADLVRWYDAPEG